MVDDAYPNVVIQRSSVSLPTEGAAGSGLNWYIEGAEMLFRVPGIVRCQVTEGRRILYECEAPATDRDVVPFLLSTGIGVVLHQRQLLALHASAVSFNGHAVAICGASGVGKSTLAASLCAAGCGFVSDDVSVVHFDPRGTPIVLPDGRQHRLWADAVEHLALTGRQGAPVRDSLQKYHVDPCTPAPSSTLPLKAIFVLREVSLPMAPGISRLSSADAAPLLRQDIFRKSVAHQMGRDAQLFFQIAALLGHVRVFRFDRESNLKTPESNVRLVLEQLEGSHAW